jgi:hypothetical protein
MTTHNPLTLAGLKKEQVKILYRDDETGIIKETSAERDPRGMGVGSILTSNIFGLDSILDRDTLRIIQRQKELAINFDRTQEEEEEFAEKSREVDQLHLAGDVRDPDYEEFVRALDAYKRSKGIWGTTLTPEQIRKRDDYALDVIRQLKQRREQRS